MTATESMNPAPNASKCSMTVSSRTARRVTASAPSTLPAAAMSAYNRALDTGEEIHLGVAAWILQDLVKQPLQCFANAWTGANTGGDEIVSFHRQVLEDEWRVSCANLHKRREHGAGSREQRQQIICGVADRRQPPTYRSRILRVRILI